MNLVLLFEQDRTSGHDRFVVRGRRAEHLKHVLRVEVGQTVRTGLLDGPKGTGRVVRVDADEVELECSLEGPPDPRPRVDLCLAIPRPKSLRKILPEVAALGVDRLVLMRTWRTEKPYLAADVLDPAHHRPLLHEGLMQSLTTHEPRVSVEPAFKPFLEDRLPLLASDSKKIVAHPEAISPLAHLEISSDERVISVIGPEGGLIPYELDRLRELGFQSVTLGPRILRVETACVVLLSSLEIIRTRGPRG